MTTKTDRDNALHLFEELAASVEEMTEEELKQELADSGLDPDEEIVAFDRVMLDGVRRHRRKARRIESEQRRHTLAPSRRLSSLPLPRQRRLLQLSFERAPSSMTAGWRNYQEVPDDEVESLLAQLDALGLLAEEDE
ncbi:hypothetical protein [Paraliomyxa miuraensis]|uniref:hypothetical protein n=1 Tax=Paraliomyxa miuraensis TaxID=376150 RepID=UPI00225292A7|nr:hypothetical protein [Paraliomyxa miuraensis]MCX4239489.1 hypothetical protein [Paraliomyxa miuraensis]